MIVLSPGPKREGEIEKPIMYIDKYPTLRVQISIAIAPPILLPLLMSKERLSRSLLISKGSGIGHFQEGCSACYISIGPIIPSHHSCSFDHFDENLHSVYKKWTVVKACEQG